MSISTTTRGTLNSKYILSKTKIGYLEWKLENFSFYSDKQVGYELISPTYAEQSWYISLYPKGMNDDSKEHVSIYLCNNREIDVKAKSRLYFVNGSGIKTIIGLTAEDYTYRKKQHYNGWGWSKAIKLADLVEPEHGFIVNDTLTILYEVTTDEDYLTQQTCAKGLYMFKKLLNSERFSDVIFSVDDRKIHAHKVVLSSCSPVFEAMFAPDMTDNNMKEIDIKEISYEVFMELLRFVYTGKIEDIERIAADLLLAAHRCALDSLKCECEYVLYQTICADNALNYLQVADACGMPGLKTNAIEFVRCHAKDVVNVPKYAEFSEAYPLLAVELTRVVVNNVLPSGEADPKKSS